MPSAATAAHTKPTRIVVPRPNQLSVRTAISPARPPPIANATWWNALTR